MSFGGNARKNHICMEILCNDMQTAMLCFVSLYPGKDWFCIVRRDN